MRKEQPKCGMCERKRVGREDERAGKLLSHCTGRLGNLENSHALLDKECRKALVCEALVGDREARTEELKTVLI